ncbi:MAG: LPXTG cell wall anchor domain-containing protein [Deltaproteobacteria bacterium]|nr:LPXTG cell wall anchor domain-containing protein [Deltaproteobacteria bacterium]
MTGSSNEAIAAGAGFLVLAILFFFARRALLRWLSR